MISVVERNHLTENNSKCVLQVEMGDQPVLEDHLHRADVLSGSQIYLGQEITFGRPRFGGIQGGLTSPVSLHYCSYTVEGTGSNYG